MKETKEIQKGRKFPVIDLGRCSECRGCLEVAPDIFFYNSETGMVDVVGLAEYPEELVAEAMKNCPKDCISWEVFFSGMEDTVARAQLKNNKG